MTASFVDEATHLATRAGDYPVYAQALFALTLALALISILVYAILFPKVAPEETPPATREPV